MFNCLFCPPSLLCSQKGKHGAEKYQNPALTAPRQTPAEIVAALSSSAAGEGMQANKSEEEKQSSDAMDVAATALSVNAPTTGGEGEDDLQGGGNAVSLDVDGIELRESSSQEAK